MRPIFKFKRTFQPRERAEHLTALRRVRILTRATGPLVFYIAVVIGLRRYVYPLAPNPIRDLGKVHGLIGFLACVGHCTLMVLSMIAIWLAVCMVALIIQAVWAAIVAAPFLRRKLPATEPASQNYLGYQAAAVKVSRLNAHTERCRELRLALERMGYQEAAKIAQVDRREIAALLADCSLVERPNPVTVTFEWIGSTIKRPNRRIPPRTGAASKLEPVVLAWVDRCGITEALPYLRIRLRRESWLPRTEQRRAQCANFERIAARLEAAQRDACSPETALRAAGAPVAEEHVSLLRAGDAAVPVQPANEMLRAAMSD